MKVTAQKFRLHDARGYKLGFLAALGASMFAAAPDYGTTEPIWPTKDWQISTPEEEGMDSKELAKLID